MSENKSLAKVSKASMDDSTRLPAILHRNVNRNVVHTRELSLFVSMFQSGPPFSGKKKLSRRQHIVVTLLMSTYKSERECDLYFFLSFFFFFSFPNFSVILKKTFKPSTDHQAYSPRCFPCISYVTSWENFVEDQDILCFKNNKMGISVESTEWLFSPLFPGKIGIWKCWFCGGRKTGVPREKPSEQGREPTTKLSLL